MKFLFYLAFLLALVACTFQQDPGSDADQTGGENEPAADPKQAAEGGDAPTQKSPEAGAGDQPAEGTGESDQESSPKETAAQPSEGENTGTSESEGGTAPQSGAKTPVEGSQESSGSTDKGKMYANIMHNTSEACGGSFGYCFGPTSTYEELKGKGIPEDKEEACTLLRKAETCLTKDHSGKTCTTDEFSKVEDLVCFSPRTVASLLLVAALCLLSRVLGQH